MKKFLTYFAGVILLLTILYQYIEEIWPAPDFFKLDPSYRNICLNYKDKSMMTRTEILKEFRKGPCSPLIVVPGQGQTRIKIEIDCQELLDKDPETFYSCNWNTCKNNEWYKIWPFYRKPYDEYGLWLPDLVGPISPLIPKYYIEKCFYNLSKTLFNKNATSYKDILLERPGLKINVHGDTKNTRGYSQSLCGLNAMNELTNLNGRISKVSMAQKQTDTLLYMGYEPGLTLQAIPYNTLQSYYQNGMAKRFNYIVKKLAEINHKKVIVYGFSLGNTQVYIALLQLDESFKNKYISNWIAHAPALSGGQVVYRSNFGFSDEFTLGPFGFSWKMFHNIWPGTSIVEDLKLSDIFESQKDESFMGNITRQIRYEKNKGKRNSTKGISFWPDFDKNCSNEKLHYQKNCMTNIFNVSDIPVVRIDGQDYYRPELNQKIIDLAYVPGAELLLKHIYNAELSQRYRNQENPNVNITLLFHTKMKTPIQFFYRDIPTKFTNNETQRIYAPDMYIHGNGDGTAATSTMLVGPLKWAIDFESRNQNNDIKNKKAIKFVEMCSQVNQKMTPYEKPNLSIRDEKLVPYKDFRAITGYATPGLEIQGKKYEFGETEYIGLQCECMHEPSANLGSNCKHLNTLADKYFIHFFSNSVITFDKVDPDLQSFEFKNNEELENFVNNCDIAYPDS